MAVRLPMPPISGTGMRKPNSARLGIVCRILAKPSTQPRMPARRVRKTPVGMATADAINMATSTGSRCSMVSEAISLSRLVGIALHVVFQLPVEAGQEGARLSRPLLHEFLRRGQHLQAAGAH